MFIWETGTARVAGKGKVLLKFTLDKSLALHSVLHVPNMCRNLVSGLLLNKAGIKLVFESNKIVLSQNGDFVGKRFCHEGLFVLETDCENMNISSNSSAYIVESLDLWHGTKDLLSSNFDMKDLGEADVILGIKIIRNSEGITLSQSHYVEKVLKKFNHFDCDPVRTLYDPSIHLKKNRGFPVAQFEYAKITGSVMFLMNCTRPNIAYAVSRLSRYTHNLAYEHWNALTRLLRYLKGTMNLGLTYTRRPTVLEGYCDANWILDNDETNSTSGYVFTLGGGAISWKFSKKTCNDRSTMEFEFVALEKAGTKAEWLRNLLADIPKWESMVLQLAPSISSPQV
uniref:Reverse transcriptase Ty1/copia-type domain-containing protein n=1 Tax=Quercus lobata TaxID=97700 RepID=A0A7N2RBZ6_QUELO